MISVFMNVFNVHSNRLVKVRHQRFKLVSVEPSDLGELSRCGGTDIQLVGGGTRHVDQYRAGDGVGAPSDLGAGDDRQAGFLGALPYCSLGWRLSRLDPSSREHPAGDAVSAAAGQHPQPGGHDRQGDLCGGGRVDGHVIAAGLLCQCRGLHAVGEGGEGGGEPAALLRRVEALEKVVDVSAQGGQRVDDRRGCRLEVDPALGCDAGQ